MSRLSEWGLNQVLLARGEGYGLPSIVAVEIFRRCAGGFRRRVRRDYRECADGRFPERAVRADALPERQGGLARFRQAPLLHERPETLRARPHGVVRVHEGGEAERV